MQFALKPPPVLARGRCAGRVGSEFFNASRNSLYLGACSLEPLASSLPVARLGTRRFWGWVPLATDLTRLQIERQCNRGVHYAALNKFSKAFDFSPKVRVSAHNRGRWMR